MKVFLSSTGRDLKAYREAAFRAIEGIGLQCVRMEDFHFAAVRIEDFDDQRIAACDLFVIILGHLHGTCPDGVEKSYTELEYETAAKLDKPRFLFVAHEDLPLPPSLRESDAKYARQRTVREQAVKGLIRDTFNSPEDLATRVVQSIANWRQTPDKTEKQSTFLPLPPQPYFAHSYPLQENFTGRLRERRMLTEWLSGGRNVLSVVAIGGMGKSALTWAWLQRDVLGLPLPGVSESDSVPDAARPEGVLWWSFYEREASFGAFVREALRYASEGRADLKAAVYDQLRALASF